MKFILITLLLTVFCESKTLVQTDSTYEQDHQQQQQQQQQHINDAKEVGILGLPAGSSSIIDQIDTTFSCVGKTYGYYADIGNDCKIYHICDPKMEPTGPNGYHFSFVCPSGSVFDQEKLTCIEKDQAINCHESLKHYQLTQKKFAGDFDEPQQKQIQQIAEKDLLVIAPTEFIRPAQKLHTFDEYNQFEQKEHLPQIKSQEKLFEQTEVKNHFKRTIQEPTGIKGGIKGGQQKIEVAQVKAVQQKVEVAQEKVEEQKVEVPEIKGIKKPIEVQQKIEVAQEKVEEQKVEVPEIKGIKKPIEVQQKIEVAQEKVEEQKVEVPEIKGIKKPIEVQQKIEVTQVKAVQQKVEVSQVKSVQKPVEVAQVQSQQIKTAPIVETKSVKGYSENKSHFHPLLTNTKA